jgi:NTE family protein
MMTDTTPLDTSGLGQVVLVLQGGGALGAYQAGVFEAIDEAGIEPDWVIGTSIGAINAGIIAGNRPADRLPRLREFWDRMKAGSAASSWFGGMPFMHPMATNAMTVMRGVKGFFEANPLAHFGMTMDPETAGYYSTAPLEKTLGDLIDMDILNACKTRLTVGAANVRTAEMRYFDSRDAPVSIKCIMASGALPPAFPAVRIDGELYWDGGILSNTPVEAVFDDNPRRSGLVFSVHIWHPHGDEPNSMARVLARQKDLQYSSRSMAQVVRQRQLHRLRHVVAELAAKLPPEVAATDAARALARYGCTTTMHVVRLVAPPVAGEDQSKDIDFSPDGITTRWRAGYADTMAVLRQAPWRAPHDPLEGFILHETEAGHVMS